MVDGKWTQVAVEFFGKWKIPPLGTSNLISQEWFTLIHVANFSMGFLDVECKFKPNLVHN